MPPAQKPAGAKGAERALPREQPVTADAATPTPANKVSASAAGAEVITMGNDDLLAASAYRPGNLSGLRFVTKGCITNLKNEQI